MHPTSTQPHANDGHHLMCQIHNSLRSFLFLSLSTTGLIALYPPFLTERLLVWIKADIVPCMPNGWLPLQDHMCIDLQADTHNAKQSLDRLPLVFGHVHMNGHKLENEVSTVALSTFVFFSSGQTEMPKTTVFQNDYISSCFYSLRWNKIMKGLWLIHAC